MGSGASRRTAAEVANLSQSDLQSAVADLDEKTRQKLCNAIQEAVPAAATSAVEKLPANAESIAQSGDLSVYLLELVKESPRGGYQPFSTTATFCATSRGRRLPFKLLSKETTRRDCEDCDTSYELSIGAVLFEMEDECGRNFRDEKVIIKRGGVTLASWTLSTARGGERLADIHTNALGIYSGLAVLAELAKECEATPQDFLNCLLKLPGGRFLRVYSKQQLLELAHIYSSALPTDAAETIEIHGVQFPRRAPQHGGNRKISSELCGLTCRQFYQFINHCKHSSKWKELSETPGFGGKLGHVNGYEICEEFVKPYTRGSGSSVALSLNPETPLQAQVMLSHSWQESMEEVQVALLSLGGLKADTTLWFCIFANYQTGDEAGDVGPTISEQLAQDPFGKVIRQPTLLGMCVVQTSVAEVYDRLWCVYEISEAVRCNVHTFSVTSNTGTSEELRGAAVDTALARCSRVEDQEMIVDKVNSSGGFPKLNDTISKFREQELKKGSEARRLLQ